MVTKSITKPVQRKKPVKAAVVKKPQTIQPAASEKYDVQKVVELHEKQLLKMDEMVSSLQNELKDIRSLIVTEKVSQTDKAREETRKSSDSSWHVLIDSDREYTQKEIIAITKISQPTLSMAKVRGHIVTKVPVGKRGWVVLGSDLLTWDNGRAIHTDQKPVTGAKKAVVAKKSVKKAQPQKKAAPAKAQVVSAEASSKPAKSVAVQKVGTKALTSTTSAKTVKPVAKPAAPSAKPAKAPVKSTAKSVKKPVSKTGSETQALIPDDIADRINALTVNKKVTQTQFGNEVDLPQKVIYEIASKKLKEISPASIQKIITVLKKYESK